ncbi:hypothetical protein, partial [Enterobacter hormaechei]
MRQGLIKKKKTRHYKTLFVGFLVVFNNVVFLCDGGAFNGNSGCEVRLSPAPPGKGLLPVVG